MQTNIWWQKARDECAWRWGSRETQERELQRGTKKYLGLMDIFTMLIVVVVSQVDIYVKTYQNVHGKHVHLSYDSYTARKVIFKKDYCSS